jgi:hypothetical protein
MRAIVLIGIMVLAATLLGTAVAAPALDVELENGKVLKDAEVVRLNPATYLVQADGQLLDLSEDELAEGTLKGVDFSKKRPPIPTHHYDQLNADGTGTRYWTMEITNRSKKVWTELRMGLAPWELRMVDQRRQVDSRGVELMSTYDPPRSKWKADSDKVVRHILHLDTPLAPGETEPITGSETSTLVLETDEGKLYRFVGDYTEDRLVNLKVRLPQWAKIERISPPASTTFEHEGCQYVTWRRFYKKGERFPLEVVYKLD